jgi:uncharacterized protein YqhQ
MNLGGQALIEGILIRSPNHVSIAVRKPNKKIKTTSYRKINPIKRYEMFYILRGFLALIDMLIIGMKALMYSAEESTNEKISDKEKFWSIALGIIFAIGLFVVLPLWISKLITKDNLLFNVLDGILRILIFIAYVLIIAQMRDVKETFKYHGAEHMAIACYENKKKLTLKNIKKFSPIHGRCGTAFIFIVLILAIIVFSFVTSESFLIKFLSRIILIPIIAGISYEILKFAYAHPKNWLINLLIIPGLLFQKITTIYPRDKHIEVAMAVVKEAVKRESIKN